ncbi:MAG: double zinc ribbon domain-containing protein, partial [Shimia sp.]
MGVLSELATRGTYSIARAVQAGLDVVYPAQCLTCDERVEGEGGLCPTCWRDVPFIQGTACDACGASLPGAATSSRELCDDCMTLNRPWHRGRAVMTYAGRARQIVMALKHRDRHDIVAPAAAWMAARGADLWDGDPVLVPIPLHRWRMMQRRYNQAALLAQEVGDRTGVEVMVDAL